MRKTQNFKNGVPNKKLSYLSMTLEGSKTNLFPCPRSKSNINNQIKTVSTYWPFIGVLEIYLDNQFKFAPTRFTYLKWRGFFHSIGIIVAIV